MTWAYDLKLGHGIQKAVLIALADHADEENSCWPSIARLVRRVEFSKRAVQAAVHELQRRGLLTIEEKSGTASRYFLHVGESPMNEECIPRTRAQRARGGSTSCIPPVHRVLGGDARGAPKPSYNHQRTPNEPTTPRRKPASAAADEDFERFWKAYPRKVGKAHARKAWEKALPKAEKGAMTIISAVNLTEWDRREDCRFVPHPATWLNREGWLDNVEEDA